MSTIDSFLFCISWDVHKMDTFSSCVWTYSAVSGFWLFVLSAFFISIVSWTVLFLQFWKRKNSALLVRWQMNYPAGVDNGSRLLESEWYQFQSLVELMKKQGADKTDKPGDKEAFQKEEWLGHFMRFRNDDMIILSIICLQLPFELAFAHVYEVLRSDISKKMHCIPRRSGSVIQKDPDMDDSTLSLKSLQRSASGPNILT